MSEQPVVTDAIDAAKFRTVLSHFCSGITVVAATNEGRPVGLTCQSFFSVSLAPTLVAFAVACTSTSFPSIRAVGSLVVNILSSGQEHISDAFARTGTDKWRGIAWSPSVVLGHPVIDGGVAYLECDIDTEIEAGDHWLVVARVRNLDVHPERAGSGHSPLLFYRGRYSQLAANNVVEGSGQ